MWGGGEIYGRSTFATPVSGDRLKVLCVKNTYIGRQALWRRGGGRGALKYFYGDARPGETPNGDEVGRLKKVKGCVKGG